MESPDDLTNFYQEFRPKVQSPAAQSPASTQDSDRQRPAPQQRTAAPPESDDVEEEIDTRGDRCGKCRDYPGPEEALIRISCGDNFCTYCLEKHFNYYTLELRMVNVPCLNRECRAVLGNQVRQLLAEVQIEKSLNKLNRVLRDVRPPLPPQGGGQLPRAPGGAFGGPPLPPGIQPLLNQFIQNPDQGLEGLESLFKPMTEQPKISSFLNGDFNLEFYMEMGRQLISSFFLRTLSWLILALCTPILLLFPLVWIGIIFIFTAFPSPRGTFFGIFKSLFVWVASVLVGILSGIWTYLKVVFFLESYIFPEIGSSFMRMFTG